MEHPSDGPKKFTTSLLVIRDGKAQKSVKLSIHGETGTTRNHPPPGKFYC